MKMLTTFYIVAILTSCIDALPESVQIGKLLSSYKIKFMYSKQQESGIQLHSMKKKLFSF